MTNEREKYHRRLVCEIDDDTMSPGFYWYEIPASDAPKRPDWLDAEARLIVTSFAKSQDRTEREVCRALECGARDVAFEYLSDHHARHMVATIVASGANPICIAHQTAPPPSVAAVIDQLERLRDSGASILKIAFPAATADVIAICINAQFRANNRFAEPVSLTPMGTRWGRIAAAAAGSALIFAPAVATPGRQSAVDMLDTLVRLDGVAGEGEL
ncbi:MAG TPA: type I 3-dehydroquinate dehydratase [Sphingomonas sp.]